MSSVNTPMLARALGQPDCYWATGCGSSAATRSIANASIMSPSLTVVEVRKRDAALEAVLDFADVVLEAPQRTDLAGMNHHVVAQQADLAVAADRAVRTMQPATVPTLLMRNVSRTSAWPWYDFLEHRLEQARSWPS